MFRPEEERGELQVETGNPNLWWNTWNQCVAYGDTLNIILKNTNNHETYVLLTSTTKCLYALRVWHDEGRVSQFTESDSNELKINHPVMNNIL